MTRQQPLSDEVVIDLRRRFGELGGEMTIRQFAHANGLRAVRMEDLLIGRTFSNLPGAIPAGFATRARRAIPDEVALFMRLAYASPNVTVAMLADAHNVSTETTWRILMGRTYKDVPGALRALRPAHAHLNPKLRANAKRKFTPEMVRDIRAAYDPPLVTSSTLALQYKTDPGTICNVLSGRSYAEIPGAVELLGPRAVEPILCDETVLYARDVFRRGLRTTTDIARWLKLKRYQTERMLYGFTHRHVDGALPPGTKILKPVSQTRSAQRKRARPVNPRKIAVRPDRSFLHSTELREA